MVYSTCAVSRWVVSYVCLSVCLFLLKINDLVDFNQAIFMYKYTHKLLPASFENIFKKLGKFERSLNYQLDSLKMCSLLYLPSSSLLKMRNNLPLDLKRSNSLSEVYSVMMCNAIFIIHSSNIFILIICMLTQPG